MDHYEKRVKAEYSREEEIFSDYFKYFENTWIKGQYFGLNDWNYSRALNEETREFSNKFHITNNSVESFNSILNSCLKKGKFR